MCQHPVLHEQYWPMLIYYCANVAQVLSPYWAKVHLPGGKQFKCVEAISSRHLGSQTIVVQLV